MCRWLAYNGPVIQLGPLLFEPDNSIVRQSLQAREGAAPVNGDGFGLGWYDETDPEPCRYRSIQPAWNDANLRDVTRNLRSRALLAHVRASTGGAVQTTNCHPFQYGRWLFCHNGEIGDFHRIRRSLMLAIDPALYNNVEGTTDSEVLFHLALTFGLEDAPHRALQQAVSFVEDTARSAGIAAPCVQMTVGITDGDRTYVARYATRGKPRSLYHSTGVPALKHLCSGHPDLAEIDPGSEVHLVVSEPLDALPGNWARVSPGTFVTLASGEAEEQPFTPSAAS